MKVAIIGATGAVGREMLTELEDSKFANKIELHLFASPKSEGITLLFCNKPITVKAFSLEALKGIPYILMSAGGSFSKEFSKQLVAQGSTVIDNSSAWRSEMPLIVPEVNGDTIQPQNMPMLIANPNCSTIQLVVALAPLSRALEIDEIHVCSYQSVSGTGQNGIEELRSQNHALHTKQDVKPKIYPQPIAFNLLAAIGQIDANGHCEEELKIIKETKKILQLSDAVNIFATTARVPVYNCHSESVTVKFKKPVTKKVLENLFAQAPGLKLMDSSSQSELASPWNMQGQRFTGLSRLRLANESKGGESQWAQFWIVADNLKIGAATNAFQILEMLAF